MDAGARAVRPDASLARSTPRGRLGAWPQSALAQGNTPTSTARELTLTRQPKLITQVEAVYPEQAVAARVEGTVKLSITISAQGDVTEAQALEGPPLLRQAALDAVRQFKFEPALINDAPAAVTLTFSVVFALPPQPARFTGQVRDVSVGPDGAALAGARVRVRQRDAQPPASAEVLTDPSGAFALEGLPPGEYDVEILAGEFSRYETTITLVGGQTSSASYGVTPLPPSIRARAIERGTKRPLPGIRVRLYRPLEDEPLQETYTDAQGVFLFRGLEPASYDLELSTQGYKSKRYKELVKPGTVLEGTFSIEPEVYDELTARTSARREERDLSRRTLNLEELRRIPGTNGDVVRVVQNLPGVARPRFLGGELVVRGAAPQDTQVFLAQDNVPALFHFLLGPAVINSEMIDSIDFYPGNFNVQYGRATAGVLNLNTRSPQTDRLHAYAKIDLIDTTLMVEGPITQDLSFAASVRRSYVDAIINAALPDDAPALVAPRYWDYQAWLTYKGFEDHTLELFFYGSDDRIALLSNDPDDPAREQFGFSNGYHRGQARWRWRPRGVGLSNDLMVSFGVNGTRVNGGDFFFDTRLAQSVVRNDTRITLTPEAELRFGVDMQLGRTDVDFVIPQDNRQSRTPPRDDRTDDEVYGGDLSFLSSLRSQGVLAPALYADLLLKPWRGAELIPGVRLDYFGTITRATTSPRLNARQRLSDAWTIKGGLGRFTQAPQLVYTNRDFGEPDLRPEQALQYALGVEWRPIERLLVDATLFYRDMRDLVIEDVQASVVDGQLDVSLYSNAGAGRAWGAELLIKRDLTDRLFGWVAYTLSRSERRDPRTLSWDLYRNDQTHILTLVAGYKLPYGIDMSARFRLVTGFPNTPVIDRVYDADRNDFEPIYARPNSGREPAFHQLDLRIDRTFAFETWMLSGYVDILNLYNAKNIEASFYNYDYTEQRRISGIPFFPTLGLIARY